MLYEIEANVNSMIQKQPVFKEYTYLEVKSLYKIEDINQIFLECHALRIYAVNACMADIFIHPHASVCLCGGSIFSVAHTGSLHPTPPLPPSPSAGKVGKRPRPPSLLPYSTIPTYVDLTLRRMYYSRIHPRGLLIHP